MRVNADRSSCKRLQSLTTPRQRQVGKAENVLGWYHSHPGYGCWLSGIDVNTQMMNQQYQEPWLAVVIDPVRTASTGKVTVGAFRTYPANYQPAASGSDAQYQSIPLNKIEDFGVHANAYYALEVSYFKSSLDTHLLDLLWNKYWLNTLSTTPHLTNQGYTTGQIQDLSEKLEQAEQALGKGRFRPAEDIGGAASSSAAAAAGGAASSSSKKDDPLGALVKDSSRLLQAEAHSMMSQVMKHLLFNTIERQADGNE
jgi:COP9 signalosome complex subunit 5